MWPFGAAYPTSPPADVDGKEFDYIVVGGGTAGCAVANRLSENPNVSVLLLEKGGVQDTWLSRVPIPSNNPHAAGITHRFSEPIVDCTSRTADVYTAEILGGATRVNAMLWTRGPPSMYEQWAQLGHPTWAWSYVEPYFKRIEDAASHPQAAYRGHGGPVRTIQSHTIFDLHAHIEKSAAAVGLPIEQDINRPTGPASGYFYQEATLDVVGHRYSSERAYLPQALVSQRRSHLTICTGAQASRLDLDAANGLVKGVYFRRADSKGDKDFFVKARREVIVCSGAICSPQLLMLSGIGPSEKLAPHGIPVVRELKGVGSHLSDHHAVPIMMELPFFESFQKLLSNPLFAVWQLLLFIFYGTGWMKSTTTASNILLKSSELDPVTFNLKNSPGDSTFDGYQPENVPDLEIMVLPINVVQEAHQGKSLFTLYAALVQPHSESHIELASNNPSDHPKIHYQMLSDPRDVDVVRKALRFTLNLADHFMHASGYRHPVKLFYAPGADSNRKWTDLGDDELEEFARKSARSALHVCCTCRMGKEDEEGVVDDELRVYGFSNLRIADASVFPKIPAAHTMAATYMVGERCADFIKKSWK